VQENMNTNKGKKLMENLQQGKFTIRDLRDQFASVLSMGNIG
jgi:signal recognition particle GTPase